VPVLQRSIAGLALMIVVVACGGSPSTSVTGPTASSVAVQTADLPTGMQKCDLSGDIDSFLNKSKTKDPNTYTSVKSEWDTAQKAGATAAYAAFYADSTAHCATIESNSADISTATYKLVINFVVQFKDEASAAKGYTTESIFGFSATQLKSGGAPVVEGTTTGLSANSIVLSASISNQSFYVAVWQNKTFMVILAMINIDAASAKKAAVAENSRTK
jgi:hypothetical protein